MVKSKLKRYSFTVDSPQVEIPYMGQKYFLGMEFLNQSLPDFVNGYQLVTAEHEIITDWLPITYIKADAYHPYNMNDPRIFIRFSLVDSQKWIDFRIDVVLRLGY